MKYFLKISFFGVDFFPTLVDFVLGLIFFLGRALPLYATNFCAVIVDIDLTAIIAHAGYSGRGGRLFWSAALPLSPHWGATLSARLYFSHQV